jgi:hypothetical protein
MRKDLAANSVVRQEAATITALAAKAGDADVAVTSMAGFAVGDDINIGGEFNSIAELAPSGSDETHTHDSIVLARPLNNGCPEHTPVSKARRKEGTAITCSDSQAGDTKIRVEVASSFAPGDAILVAHEATCIEAIDEDEGCVIVSLGWPLKQDYPRKTLIAHEATVFTTAKAKAGETKLVVTGTKGFAVGDGVRIHTELNAIASLDSDKQFSLERPLIHNIPEGTDVSKARIVPKEATTVTTLDLKPGVSKTGVEKLGGLEVGDAILVGDEFTAIVDIDESPMLTGGRPELILGVALTKPWPAKTLVKQEAATVTAAFATKGSYMVPVLSTRGLASGDEIKLGGLSAAATAATNNVGGSGTEPETNTILRIDPPATIVLGHPLHGDHPGSSPVKKIHVVQQCKNSGKGTLAARTEAAARTSEPTKAGQTKMPVETTKGFSAGDAIFFGEEHAAIKDVDEKGNSIELADGLSKDYPTKTPFRHEACAITMASSDAGSKEVYVQATLGFVHHEEIKIGGAIYTIGEIDVDGHKFVLTKPLQSAIPENAILVKARTPRLEASTKTIDIVHEAGQDKIAVDSIEGFGPCHAILIGEEHSVVKSVENSGGKKVLLLGQPLRNSCPPRTPVRHEAVTTNPNGKPAGAGETQLEVDDTHLFEVGDLVKIGGEGVAEADEEFAHIDYIDEHTIAIVPPLGKNFSEITVTKARYCRQEAVTETTDSTNPGDRSIKVNATSGFSSGDAAIIGEELVAIEAVDEGGLLLVLGAPLSVPCLRPAGTVVKHVAKAKTTVMTKKGEKMLELMYTEGFTVGDMIKIGGPSEEHLKGGGGGASEARDRANLEGFFSEEGKGEICAAGIHTIERIVSATTVLLARPLKKDVPAATTFTKAHNAREEAVTRITFPGKAGEKTISVDVGAHGFYDGDAILIDGEDYGVEDVDVKSHHFTVHPALRKDCAPKTVVRQTAASTTRASASAGENKLQVRDARGFPVGGEIRIGEAGAGHLASGADEVYVITKPDPDWRGTAIGLEPPLKFAVSSGTLITAHRIIHDGFDVGTRLKLQSEATVRVDESLDSEEKGELKPGNLVIVTGRSERSSRLLKFERDEELDTKVADEEVKDGWLSLHTRLGAPLMQPAPPKMKPVKKERSAADVAAATERRKIIIEEEEKLVVLTKDKQTIELQLRKLPSVKMPKKADIEEMKGYKKPPIVCQQLLSLLFGIVKVDIMVQEYETFLKKHPHASPGKVVKLPIDYKDVISFLGNYTELVHGIENYECMRLADALPVLNFLKAEYLGEGKLTTAAVKRSSTAAKTLFDWCGQVVRRAEAMLLLVAVGDKMKVLADKIMLLQDEAVQAGMEIDELGNEFQVIVSRGDGPVLSKHGLQFAPGGLKVVNIGDGFIKDFNSKDAPFALQAGDVITAVNGVTDVDTIMDQLQYSPFMVLKATRGE